MTRKQWIVVGAIVALIVIPVVLKLSRDDTNKVVDLERVTTRALTPTVLASGSLTYESQVTLAPEVTGRVKEILVKEQQEVSRGQKIGELGSNDSGRPKLHFQIRKGSAPVDPLRYLPAS